MGGGLLLASPPRSLSMRHVQLHPLDAGACVARRIPHMPSGLYAILCYLRLPKGQYPRLCNLSVAVGIGLRDDIDSGVRGTKFPNNTSKQ
jgi:hypothetical protein